jgi:hypothetical protein
MLSRQDILDIEKQHMRPLLVAVDKTGDNRVGHVGVLLHRLLLHLTMDERYEALDYLHRALRFSLH